MMLDLRKISDSRKIFAVPQNLLKLKIYYTTKALVWSDYVKNNNLADKLNHSETCTCYNVQRKEMFTIKLFFQTKNLAIYYLGKKQMENVVLVFVHT